MGEHTKKSDKTNKKNERIQLLGEIGEIKINYFTQMKNERRLNWNFQNNEYIVDDFLIFLFDLEIYCQDIFQVYKPVGFFFLLIE